ncbi:MAG: metal ABC transporter substrate-binding protein [Bdellovibrionota bacterium]|nr:MAG: metal ABC transporter substrate-binding protein [Bdellovibrionota bacterium]
MKHLLLFSILFGAFASTRVVVVTAEEPLRVVTTTATFASLVREIGGEVVRVDSIASPKLNPHFIEPRPSDVVRLKRADLFVHSGLDLELWRGPLVDAVGRIEMRAGGEKELGLASVVSIREALPEGITRSEGDIHRSGNPHFWHAPDNVIAVAKLLADRLAMERPSLATVFAQNAERFIESIVRAEAEWRMHIASFRGRELVGYHNEWPYLMEFLGLRMRMFMEPKPGIAPTPRHIAVLQQYIQEHKVAAIVQATFYPDDAARAIAETMSIPLLKLCQNIGELPECADYLSMMAYNVGLLKKALAAR